MTYSYFIDCEVRPPVPGFREHGQDFSNAFIMVNVHEKDTDEYVCQTWHDAYVDLARFVGKYRGRTHKIVNVSGPFVDRGEQQ